MERFMNFLETSFQPNESQKQLFEFVESITFPWFFHKGLLSPFEETKDTFYAHSLRLRHSDESLPVEGKNNSGGMQAMEDIFFEIAKSNKVEVDVVLRSAVNATHHSKQSMTGVHTDHEFEHNNFLLYLNDVTGGETVLFSEDESIELKTITPTKYKAVFFSNTPHAHKFCAYGERRLVFVVTFLGKIPTSTEL
jgi:hypothetical protein